MEDDEDTVQDTIDEDEFRRFFPKHLKCFAHSLQLPLRKVIDNDPIAKNIRIDIGRILNKFHHSHSATATLKSLTGKIRYSY